MRQHEARLKFVMLVLAVLLAGCGSTGQEVMATSAPRPSATTTADDQAANQRIAWTAEVERQKMQILEWTATAAPSAIPATQTQAAAMQRAIETQQSIISTAMVMTQNAPTMVVAMAEAQTMAQYSELDMLVRLFALFGLGCFFLGISVFLFRKPMMREEEPVDRVYPLEMGTVVTIKKENSGYLSTSRLVLPCSAEQLTELADGLISGEKSLAINVWEGRNSQTFTRESFAAVRNFLQVNRLAQSAGVGRLVLTAEGEAFLRAWQDKRALPSSYEFEARTNEKRGEIPHDHEDHERPHGLGEVAFDRRSEL